MATVSESYSAATRNIMEAGPWIRTGAIRSCKTITSPLRHPAINNSVISIASKQQGSQDNVKADCKVPFVNLNSERR